jgi:hypothetical protein
MTECANNNLNPDIGPSGNTSSIDDRIQEFEDRIDAVGDKLEILTSSLGSPDDYDDRNIVAGDMDSLIMGGGGAGGQGSGNGCDFDLTIKANTYIWTLDQCSDPLAMTMVTDTSVINATSSTSMGGTGTFTIENTMTQTNLNSPTLVIGASTSTTITSPTFSVSSSSSISLTGPSNSNITLGTTTVQSLLTRLAEAESAITQLQTDVATAQSTADGAVSDAAAAQGTADDAVTQSQLTSGLATKLNTSTFNSHTHSFSDGGTASGVTGLASANGLPSHSHSFSDSVTISGETDTPS